MTAIAISAPADDSGAPVAVARTVYEGLEAVRASARFNMGAIRDVADWCRLHGYPAACEWILANPVDFAHGVFVGFVVGEERAA